MLFQTIPAIDEFLDVDNVTGPNSARLNSAQ